MVKKICFAVAAAVAAAGSVSAQSVEHGTPVAGSECAAAACGSGCAEKGVSPRRALSYDDVVGSYYFSGTTYGADGTSEKIFSPFTIEHGNGSGQYLIKKFIYDDSFDLNATEKVLMVGDQISELHLVIPSGQELFLDGGSTFRLYAGFADADGWGANTRDDSFQFSMTETGFKPAYAFADGHGGTIPGGLAVGYRQGQQLLGWGFSDVAMVRCNGRFKGLFTTDGINYTEAENDVYGVVAEVNGVKALAIYGIGGLSEPLRLVYDHTDGSLVGRDQLAGSFTKYGETFDGYYTNGDPDGFFPKDMIVEGAAVTADGCTSVSLGNEMLVWYPSQGDYYCAWGSPRVDFNVDLGIGLAGILPSVADDCADAAAETVCYSLQGVPVASPEPGQLVICRRGATVSKQIWR